MPEQEFVVRVTAQGKTEDDRLKAAYEQLKGMTLGEFAMAVEFDDLDEEEN